jgi:hypothetical protein
MHLLVSNAQTGSVCVWGGGGGGGGGGALALAKEGGRCANFLNSEFFIWI